MNVMKTSLTIIPNVSSGAPFSLLEIVQAYPLLHKGLGHLASLYLLYLLVTRYYLSYHKTICYRWKVGAGIFVDNGGIIGSYTRI